MKRLICSAAVASALLAVTAIPSGAVTVTDLADLFGISTDNGHQYGLLGNDTYTFTLPTTEFVSVVGAEFNIAPFTVTGHQVYHFRIVQLRYGGSSSFSGSGILAAGTYTLVVSGTGGKHCRSTAATLPASAPCQFLEHWYSS